MYKGSITVPPCNDCYWIVFDTMLGVKLEEVEEIERVWKEGGLEGGGDDGEDVGGNARKM